MDGGTAQLRRRTKRDIDGAGPRIGFVGEEIRHVARQAFDCATNQGGGSRDM
jgi:hypothetical protein